MRSCFAFVEIHRAKANSLVVTCPFGQKRLARDFGFINTARAETNCEVETCPAKGPEVPLQRNQPRRVRSWTRRALRLQTLPRKAPGLDRPLASLHRWLCPLWVPRNPKESGRTLGL